MAFIIAIFGDIIGSEDVTDEDFYCLECIIEVHDSEYQCVWFL